MVCRHIYTGQLIRRGIYPEYGELKQSGIGDSERFWHPLKDALVEGLESPSQC